MLRNSIRRRLRKGFTLIELSIVIIVISIIVAGYISINAGKLTNLRTRIGSNNIYTTYKSLANYVRVNKKFPCPAPITDIKSSSPTYGTAASATNCVAAGVYVSTVSGSTNLVYGMIPTRTLGLADEFAEDSFGNKIIYVVDKRLTSTAIVSGSDLTYFENTILTSSEYSNGTATPYTGITISGTSVTDALFLIMSRGNNKSGAYAANSSSASASVSTESTNDLSSPSNGVSPPTSSFDKIFLGTSSASDFDDTVFYKTRDQFFNDFDLWSIVPCPGASSAESLYCSTSFTWPKAYPGQTVSSADGIGSCPEGWTSGPDFPSKKCGQKGQWGSVTKPCIANDVIESACHSGACQRIDGASYAAAYTNALSTANGFVPSGTTFSNKSWSANGDTITLNCNSGYGKAITGSFRSLTSSSETQVCATQNDGSYGFPDTNRTATPASIICNNGSWTISNACSACRSCSSTTGAVVYTISHQYETFSPLDDSALYNGACYGKYQTGSSFPSDYDCYGINGTSSCSGNKYLLTLSSAAHLGDQNACQYQAHVNNSCGSIIARCVDGRFYGLLKCASGSTCGNGYNGYWGTSCNSDPNPGFGALVNYDGTGCNSGSVIKYPTSSSISTSYNKTINGCNLSRTLSTGLTTSCVSTQSFAHNQTYTCVSQDSDSADNGLSGPLHCSHIWGQTSYYTFTCYNGEKRLTSSYCVGNCGSGSTNYVGAGFASGNTY